MPETKDKTELKIPDWLKKKAPWLNFEYVKKNGWVPVSNSELFQSEEKFRDTPFGRLPLVSENEIKEGDIIIFNDYREIEGKYGYETDRFIIIERLEQWEMGLRIGGRMIGTTVHPPKPLTHKVSDFGKKIFNHSPQLIPRPV
ncbi:MAG: hypothetical protein Athens071426_634 [Parcubacteria group bacterium Athens0714_26]|nr:MAG: hypothetical protein Athens101426_156 [Parcubacteria group bacterium Athens1014_26]TSD01854.1 MAG: hypothetical protein Athens071426_634 [Parcubacteria group bacterium Athens0714_26]